MENHPIQIKNKVARNETTIAALNQSFFNPPRTSHCWIQIINEITHVFGFPYTQIAYRIGSSPSSIQKLVKDFTRTPRDKMLFNLCNYYYKLFYGTFRSEQTIKYIEEKNHSTLSMLLTELSQRGYFDECNKPKIPNNLLNFYADLSEQKI